MKFYDYNFTLYDKYNINLILDRKNNVKMKLKLLFEVRIF